MKKYTFAVSDVHGCLDELKALMDHYEKLRPVADTTFVVCGDYVDRGPDSAGVVRYCETRFDHKLLGNHEDMLLDAYHGDPYLQMQWMQSYGYTTCQSFKIDHVRDMPVSYINWFKDLKLLYNDGLRTFVHAGIRRDRPITEEAQDKQFSIWARDEFMYDLRSEGGFVVHGHTPRDQDWPDFYKNRLNLDTACVWGGILSGAIFDNEAGVYPTHFLNHHGKIIEAKEVAKFYVDGSPENP